MASNERLLSVLDSYGEQFMAQFDIPDALSKKRKLEDVEEHEPTSESTDEDEEWMGISHSDNESTSEDNLVIFEELGHKSETEVNDSSDKRRFMASKIAKISNSAAPKNQGKQWKEQDDYERLNVENDALLHQLIHTKLLSGSLNRDLGMTPAQRQKALEGRVKELSGTSKLGKGEGAVRQAEHNKATSSIRQGIAQKKKQVQKKKLEEAKAVGNYHPAIKGLLSEDTDRKRTAKRQRGLRMGVGKFSGGILRLGAQEIPGRAPGPSAERRR